MFSSELLKVCHDTPSDYLKCISDPFVNHISIVGNFPISNTSNLIHELFPCLFLSFKSSKSFCDNKHFRANTFQGHSLPQQSHILISNPHRTMNFTLMSSYTYISQESQCSYCMNETSQRKESILSHAMLQCRASLTVCVGSEMYTQTRGVNVVLTWCYWFRCSSD